MAASVPLELADGHLVAQTGGSFLIDTGSPTSFSRTEHVDWGGQRHALATSMLGLDSRELSDLIGTPLDGLLGGDVLGKSPFTVDVERGVCSFGVTPTDRDAIELPLRLVLGVPLTNVPVDEVPTEACIDTGARLSYLDRSRLTGSEVVGEADDFYPGFGAFRTTVHEVSVQIAASAVILRVGVLPDELSGMLAVLGITAILGSEIFDRFPMVTFDYSAAVARLYLPSS